MSLSKHSYTDGRGRRQRTANYYVHFRDHRGSRRNLPGFKDKGASAELERLVSILVERRISGEGLNQALSRRVEQLTPAIQKRLAKWGILDARRVAALKGLDKHLDDFQLSLEAQDRAPKHVRQVVRNTRVVFEAIGARVLGDVRADRVQQALKNLRAGEGGLSVQTTNHHLRAVKQFCKWAVASELLTEDPLRLLKPLNAKVDRRRERRAFSAEELRRLLDTTSHGPEHKGLTGEARALLYRLAVQTGLRANEIRSLKRSSLDLESGAPTVTVPAKSSKRRRDDVLPLREELAQALRDALREHGPWEPLFALKKSWRPAEMLRFDLRAVGIPVADDQGRVLDFHSFRHTFVSNLLRSGASQTVVKSLARHSTLVLSVDTYGHLEDGEDRVALRNLPKLDVGPEAEAFAATGTDGREAGDAGGDAKQDPDLYQSLYQPGADQCSPMPPQAGDWRRCRDSNPGSVARRQFSKLLH